MVIRVLIVDDSIFIRQTLTKLLNQDDRFKVIGTASNGKNALKSIEELKPDVVTLDVEMPVMDGLATLAAIMSKKALPVVMLSSLTKQGAATTIKALELGAVDFVTKPVGGTGQNLAVIEEELKEKLILAAGSKPAKLRKKLIVSGALESKIPAKVNTKIVVIGASTGGPSALSEVVQSLPENLPVPVVIVQHMPLGFTKLLADRLNNSSKLTVSEMQEGEEIKAGHVFVVPAGYNVLLKKQNNKIFVNLTDRSPVPSPFRPSLDTTLFEVTKEFGEAVLAVVLTGMGNDGLRGAKALKSAGGKVIAESQETCVVFGMPKVVIEANLADEIIPIQDMAGGILRNLI